MHGIEKQYKITRLAIKNTNHYRMRKSMIDDFLQCITFQIVPNVRLRNFSSKKILIKITICSFYLLFTLSIHRFSISINVN